MSSKQDFVDFIIDQIQDADLVTYKKMFGEYALYCEGKVFALVCDNKLYIKPGAGGKSFL